MSALTLAETNKVKGMLLAVRHCGSWITVGTLSDYITAVDRAARETDRAVECWQRWVRRYDPNPVALELGSGRVNVRHEVAKALLEGRSEVVQAFIGPAAGSA